MRAIVDANPLQLLDLVVQGLPRHRRFMNQERSRNTVIAVALKSMLDRYPPRFWLAVAA